MIILIAPRAGLVEVDRSEQEAPLPKLVTTWFGISLQTSFGISQASIALFHTLLTAQYWNIKKSLKIYLLDLY